MWSAPWSRMKLYKVWSVTHATPKVVAGNCGNSPFSPALPWNEGWRTLMHGDEHGSLDNYQLSQVFFVCIYLDQCIILSQTSDSIGSGSQGVLLIRFSQSPRMPSPGLLSHFSTWNRLDRFFSHALKLEKRCGVGTWHGYHLIYPIIYGVLYIPGGAGFLPSTVSPDEITQVPMIQRLVLRASMSSLQESDIARCKEVLFGKCVIDS